MAFTTLGIVSGIVAFPTQLWPAGSKSIGPVTLPVGVRIGALIIDISQLTELTTSLFISIDQSNDGGNTWQIAAITFGLDLPTSGLTLVGGLLSNGDGVTTTSWAPVKFPNPNNTIRQIRATASLTVPATIGCTLVVW